MTGKTKTICLVEDDPMIQEAYSVKLKKRGFRVLTASDGAEGLKIITREIPDLALIDINMPVMDGLELIEKLNKDPRLSKMPIIVLTNYDDQKTVRHASKLSTHYYLVKALYTPQKVADVVDEALCMR